MSIELSGGMELITPKDAAYILESKNKSNRPLRAGTISQYAREMIEGRWNSGVSDAIAFTVEGELLNGQHRLSAVVQANISIRFFVARNVPKNAFAYMDIGARRTISDRTRLDRTQSDIVTMLIRICGAGNHAAADPTEVLEVYNLLRPHIEPFIENKGKRAKGATASHRAALVMLSAEGFSQQQLLTQLTAFIEGSDVMFPSLKAMHSKINNRKTRLSTGDREEVFSEAIRAYTNRTDKLRDIITEYRAKFGALLPKTK